MINPASLAPFWPLTPTLIRHHLNEGFSLGNSQITNQYLLPATGHYNHSKLATNLDAGDLYMFRTDAQLSPGYVTGCSVT